MCGLHRISACSKHTETMETILITVTVANVTRKNVLRTRGPFHITLAPQPKKIQTTFLIYYCFGVVISTMFAGMWP